MSVNETLPDRVANVTAGGPIVFKVKKEAPIEDPDDIRFILGDTYVSRVYFESKPMEQKTATLAYMLERLDPDKFVRINKHVIIKICLVKNFEKCVRTGFVKLFGGDEFEVSELYLIRFENMYNEMEQQREFWKYVINPSC